MPLSEWFLGNDSSGAAAWTGVVAERGVTFNYVVKGGVTSALSQSYAVRGSAQKATVFSYAVRANIAQAYAFSYGMAGSTGGTLLLQYAIRSLPTSLLQSTYEILPYSGGGTGNNAPTSLAISTIGSSATLTWNTDTTKEAYKVYSAPLVSGPFNLVATLGNVLTYTYSGLLPATPIYFTVSAVKTGVESAKIVPALVAVMPPATDVIDGDDVITTWPITITGNAGPSQPIAVTIGNVTRNVVSTAAGTYAATFTAADGIPNGAYTAIITATFAPNQSITNTRNITVNGPVVDPDGGASAMSAFFFMGF